MEKALVRVIQEARIAGASTRRVDSLIPRDRHLGISKSSVPELCKGIDQNACSAQLPIASGS